MKILVYQNNRDIALRAFLEQYNYEVTLLDSGQAALMNSLLENTFFNLIITEELAANNPFDNIDVVGKKNAMTPIILLTSIYGFY